MFLLNTQEQQRTTGRQTTTTELRLFTDAIDAFGRLASGQKAIVTQPKAERERMHRALDEAYRFIDTTLNMVFIRLGDILPLAADEDLRAGSPS